MVLGLSLTTCGGGDEGGDSSPTVQPNQDPWKNVGAAVLPSGEEVVTDRVRVLAFGDGMTISYDGSDSVEEEVCRREGTHQVCMPLVEDPYWSLLRPQALLENFETGVICRIDGVEQDDCDEVFPSMGGGDFACETGVINGDKALICTDDWAVVVNGGESETKTLCRVHVGTGMGRCLGAPEEGVADGSLILEMQRTRWSRHLSERDDPHQALSGDTLQPVTPDHLPAGAQLVWRATEESVCTIDEDGAVAIDSSATAPAVCPIVLKVRAPGFAKRTLFGEIPIVKDNDAAWADYTVGSHGFWAGESLSAGAVTSTNPATVDVEYSSADESVCTVDASGTVTALIPGECEISLTASKSDHLTVALTKTLTITEGVLGLTWAGYTGSNVATFGADAPTLDLPSVAHPADGNGVVYSYTATGGGCEVEADTGALTLLGADITEEGRERNCVVTVTSSRTGYPDETAEQTVDVAKGRQTTTAAYVHGGAVSLAEGEELRVVNPPTGGFTRPDYRVYSGNCEVDGDGTITVKGEAMGTCSIRIGWIGDDNYDVGSGVLANIPLVTSTQTFAWGDDPYGANYSLNVGDAGALALAATHTGSGRAEYRSETPGVCTVDDASGAVTPISAGECLLWGRFVGDSSTGASPWIELSLEVGEGTQTWSVTDPYGANPTAKVGAELVIVTAPTAQGEARYSVTEDSEGCEVNLKDGTVTGTVSGGTCTVQVAFTATDNYGEMEAADLATITVTNGSQAVNFEDPYGESPILRLGAEEPLAIVNAPTSNAGGRMVYQVSGGGVNYCTVDTNTGSVTVGTDVGNCVIEAGAAAVENYDASDWTEVASIAIKGQIMEGVGWSPPSPGRVGQELTLPKIDTGEYSGVATNFEITDKGGTGCASRFDLLRAETVLSFTKPGYCHFRVWTRLAGYEDRVWKHALRVHPGEASATWGSFTGSLMVGGNTVAPAAVSGTPAGSTVSYRLARGEADCDLVDATDGTVRARVVPIARELVDADENPETPDEEVVATVCTLVGVLEKDNYRTHHSPPIEILLEEGSMGTLTAPEYGRGTILPLGERVPVVSLPVESNGLPLDTSYSVQALDTDGNPKEGDVCLLEVDGSIVTGADGVKGDICRVTARATSVGYNPKDTPVVNLQVVDVLAFAEAPAVNYSVGLKMGVTASIGPDTLPAADNNEVSVTWRFEATGTDSEGEAKEDVCTVVDDPTDNNHGNLALGSSALSGDTCQISVIGRSQHYADYLEAVPWTGTVAMGDLVFGGATIPTYSGALRIGGYREVTVPNSPTDANGIAVAWGSWRVEGTDTDGSDHDNICTIDNSQRVDATDGVPVTAGDVCKVYATATAPHYNDKEELIHSFTIADKDNFGTLTAPEYTGKLTVGRAAKSRSSAPTASPAVAGATWSYSASGTRGGSTPAGEVICTISADGTSLSPGANAQAGDICTVTATVSFPGYNDKSITVDKTLHGTFSFASTPTLTYTGSLKFADTTTLLVPSALPNTDANGVSLSWSYSVNGYQSDGTTAKAAVCHLASNTPGHSDYGKVKGGASAAVGDRCKIYFTASSANYISTEYQKTLVVGKAEQPTSPGGWSNPYGANQVLVGETLALDTTNSTPPTGQGPLRYKLTYFDSNANHSCTLNGNTGAVTGSRVSNNNQACTVEARFNGNSNYHASPWNTIARITVVRNAQSAPTVTDSWGNTLYGSVASPRVGPNGSVDPSWNWTNVRGAGHGTFECRVKPSSSSHCSVDSSTCVVTGTTTAGSCVVQGKYGGNSNYAASPWGDVATITVTAHPIQAKPGSWTNAYGTSHFFKSIVYGDVVEVGNGAPTNPTSGGGALEYSIESGSQWCRINDAATGQVEAISAAASFRNCYVQARWKGVPNSYEASDYTRVRWFEVRRASQAKPNFGNQNPYAGIRTVQSSRVLYYGETASIGTGIAPTNTGQGALEYTDDGSNACTVDASTGTVTALTLSNNASSSCGVSAKFKATALYNPSPGTFLITISVRPRP